MVFSPGDLIGQKYRLVRRLGEGGMAAVWVAHNEALDIHVAVKFIRNDIRDPQLADRLLQEARTAARIDHPAIVRVTDFGKTRPGHPYIVMELLSGEDLGMLLDRVGRVDAVQAVRTLLPVVGALVAAHDKGIVHRDLKPENIFLARSDDGAIRPKLVDFGIAKFEHEDFKRLTDFGVALGSPGYMSPEQARGDDADPRSDVWALCVVLYEVVTGRLPFDGDTYNALLRAVIENEAKPITELAAGDSRLWSILEHGFVKPREGRWQSMRELGAALADWLVERGYADDIAGGSLQATWLQRRSASDEDLVATPPLSGTSPVGRGSLDHRTAESPPPGSLSSGPAWQPGSGAGTAAPATSSTQASLPAIVGEPRRPRSPLFTVALFTVALFTVAVTTAAFVFSRTDRGAPAARALPVSRSPIPPTSIASTAPVQAAPGTTGTIAYSAAPAADGTGPETGVTAPAPASARPAPRPARRRRLYHTPRRKRPASSDLDLKTTL